jgi:hypothetical protein
LRNIRHGDRVLNFVTNTSDNDLRQNAESDSASARAAAFGSVSQTG